MATSLDISLDDIIKKSRNNNQRFRGRGRPHRGGRGAVSGPNGGRMAGAVRRGAFRVVAQPSSHTIAKSVRRTKSFPWRHDLFEDSLRAAGISGQETGTKLYLSNLDHGVTNEDIRELFADIGDLKRYTVHYDKNGRSSGSAEVVYTRRSDAFAALKRYNNVQLDGKPMKIEIIGTSSEVPVSARVNVFGGSNGSTRRTVVMRSGSGIARGGGMAAVNRGSGQSNHGGMRNSGRGRGGAVRGGGRGGAVSGRGRGAGGRGRGKKQPVEKSAVELDKELETYHSEAMHT